MDAGTPPLLSGSTTRLDCVVDMLDILLLRSRTPQTGTRTETEAETEAEMETEADRDVVISHKNGPVSPGKLTATRLGDELDATHDARISGPELCDHSEDKLRVPDACGPSGDAGPLSVDGLSTARGAVSRRSDDCADADLAVWSDVSEPPLTSSVQQKEDMAENADEECNPAQLAQSPVLFSVASLNSPLPRDSVTSSQPSEPLSKSPADPQSGLLPNSPSEAVPARLSQLSGPSTDSGVSESPTDTEPSPALDASSAGDSPLSNPGDSTGDEARALPQYWWLAGGGGPRRGPRWRAGELRSRPLSAISTSSSSSGTGSLPRALVRRRPRLGGQECSEDFSGTAGARLGYLSSSGTSISCPPASSPSGPGPSLSQAGRVVAEIVQTEAVYVNDLREVIEGYLLYWRDNPEPTITDEHKEALFGNYQQIYHCNREFLSALELCDLDPPRVAECFVDHQHRFVVYTEYCTQYPRAMATLTRLMRRGSATARRLRERQEALNHTLPLGSYLLKPVQRILKYHLLLQSLMTRSAESPESDRAATAAALRSMRDLAGHIDEMKRRHESAVRVQEVQSLVRLWQGDDLTTFGELLAEETFRVPRAKMPRHVFLFEKILLITKKRDDGTLVYKTHIMCSNLMLIESVPGEMCSLQVLPFDDPRQQYTLQARSIDCKQQWAMRLKNAILESYVVDIPKHARELVMKLGQHRENGDSLRRRIGRRHHSVPAYLERRRTVKRAASAASAPQGASTDRQAAPQDQQGASQRARRPGGGVSRWSVPSGPVPTEQEPSEDDAPWPTTGAPSLPEVDEEGSEDVASDARLAAHVPTEADEADSEDIQTIVEHLVMQKKQFQRLLERPRREVRRSPTSSSDSHSERSERSDRSDRSDRSELEVDTDSCLDELGITAPSVPEEAVVDGETPVARQAAACSRPQQLKQLVSASDVREEREAAAVSTHHELPAPASLLTPGGQPQADARPVSALTIESHDNVEYVSLFDYGVRPPAAAAGVPTAAVASSAGSASGVARGAPEPCRNVARRLTRLHQAGQTEVRQLFSGIRSQSLRLGRHPRHVRRVKEDGDQTGLGRRSGATSSRPQRATWYCESADAAELPTAAPPKRRGVKPSSSFRVMMRRSGSTVSGQNRWRPLSQLFETTTRSRAKPQLASEVHAVSLQRLPAASERWDLSDDHGSRPTPVPFDASNASSRSSTTSLPAVENQRFLLASLEGGMRRLRQRLAELVLGASSEVQSSTSDVLGARLACSDLLQSPLLTSGPRRCAMRRDSVISVTSEVSCQSSSCDSDSGTEDYGCSGFYEMGMDILENVRVEVCW